MGYFIYVLSNIIEDLFIYLRNQYDFFSLLAGQILSFQEKFIKPETQIYQILLDRYNLIPNESLSLDDHNSCLEPAIKRGMYTMLIKLRLILRQNLKN